MDRLTRDNVDSLLDAGRLQGAISHPSGVRWWRLRRNGKTRTWKRDASRFEVPVKAGLRTTGRISDADLLSDGTINPAYYRIAPDGES